MIRIDLHTHSEASKDGGITPEQYAELLKNETLDVIAITDHNRIDFAKGMQKALGKDYIIVGEEISTTQGDIIGLYLSTAIEPGMSAVETVKAIKAQNGLVYIPHPFEKTRKGIQQTILHEIADMVDIIETNNGRALRKKHSVEAQTWSVKNKVSAAASSDAHGLAGVGHTYTAIAQRPNRHTLVHELENAAFTHNRPPLKSLIYPKYNLLKNKFKGLA
jgi:predicted metal-dependent phosphoesterase TrpH